LRWRFHPEFFDLRDFANDSEGSDAKTPAPADVARAAAISSCDSAGTPGCSCVSKELDWIHPIFLEAGSMI
jgi:hypothetical protein